MSAVMTAPDVPAVTNRCKMDEVFASPFIELIALAPRNPVVRGLILSQTRKMPGPECGTFEQIREWVETTCEPRAVAGHQTKAAAEDGIAIKVEFSEIEYGRANYSVPRSGCAEFALDAEELLDIVREAIDDEDGISAVVEKIASLIDDEAWDRCQPDLDDYGDYDYGDHDSDDSGESETDYSKVQIRERVLGFLRHRHPELLEEIV